MKGQTNFQDTEKHHFSAMKKESVYFLDLKSDFLSFLGDFLPAKLNFYLFTYSYSVPWGRRLMPLFISGILLFLLKKTHFFPFQMLVVPDTKG